MIYPPERMPERDAAILATARHVPFDGWTKRALRAGVADAGLPDDETDLLFPLGIVDMIETFSDLADRRMEEAAKTITETRLSGRVRAVIALRLEQNRPYKEAVRRALSILALPANAPEAAACTARTIDAIWYAAGDRSADFSWYTKRAILTAIYTATLLYWLGDTSEDDAPTLAFLDRRLAAFGRIHQVRKRVDSLLARVPRPPALRPPPGVPRAVGDTD
ncbi:MAG TPA: COQ9 family protein [Rhodopila sp.]|jgi:ubiquinone biosynthesis protein COQ9|nr:COQ9 family protein [Rhodopila sp.]